jgi:hypothetical protein
MLKDVQARRNLQVSVLVLAASKGEGKRNASIRENRYSERPGTLQHPAFESTEDLLLPAGTS